MAVYSDILQSMVGRVKAVKANAREIDCRQFINDRIRRIIDRRIFWADLLSRTVVNVPAPYIIGQISLTQGSTVVTGSATGWPVSDVVNGSIPAGIQDYGYQEVTPDSMAGIDVDTMLYVDAAGVPEVVAVISVSPTTFTAKFAQFHNADCTITSSSMAGWQLKTQSTYPIYTVRAITSATRLIIENPWAGINLTTSYQLIKTLYTIAPDMKDVLVAWDPLQGMPLRFHISLAEANLSDPQRMNVGDPIGFVDHSPSEAGTMQYEIWPNQTIARQIPIVYTKQWPELINPTDRPPWFINPSVIVDGAIADALCVNNGQPPEGKDPYFNPKLADRYEAKFEQGLQYAMNADESKAQQALDSFMSQIISPGGASYWQSHDWDAMMGAL